jgi:hypothetical protein
MAKLSILDMTQDILNDLDSDEVNSINDTLESIQIAQIIKTTYFNMMANRNWPHLKRTLRLASVSDVFRPTHLKVQDEVKEVISFSYNKKKVGDTRDYFEELKWLEPEDFIRKFNHRNLDESNVVRVYDGILSGAPVYIRNDKQPEYYTSFDDEQLVLDSFDSAIETTVESINTQALVYYEPSWTHEDSFIPDLPMEAFPALLSEAKSTAFLVLKQMPNQKAEQDSQRQQRWLSRKSWKVNGGVRYPNYGRVSRSPASRRSPYIDKDGTV